MAQHDYVIANGSGSAVRSDLNNALAAIVSHNSGTSEPTTTYAYMPWADTSAGVMKLRNGANNAWITLYQLDGEYTTIPLENGTAAAPSLYFKTSGTDTGLYSPGTDQVAISTAGTGRLFVGSDGKVGIGTNTLDTTLTVGGTNAAIRVQPSNAANAQIFLRHGSLANNSGLEADNTGALAFYANGSERSRIDSSGRLLAGTSTSVTNLYRATTASIAPTIQLENVTNSYSTGFSSLNYSASGFAPVVTLGLSKSNTQGTNTVVASGDELGYLQFVGADGTNFRTAAWIKGEVDGTPGSADMPGRLVFSTTADGASSPTERLRVASNGAWGLAGANYGSSGQALTSNGSGSAPTWQSIPAPAALSTASGSAPSYSARAWVNFDGTGTVAIRASGNVSSITDNGTGDYTVNFTTAMADADYSYALNGKYDESGGGGNAAVAEDRRTSSRVSSSLRVNSFACASGTSIDFNTITAIIFR